MEPSHRIPHTSVEVAEAVENGINMIKRVGKRTSDAAEELMDDTSQRIKRHPAETVVMAFAAGFLVGGFISWLARRR
jgi:ElaB/YqjD/DUF883 family membrane-anchored ribosome-binding protein